MKTNPESESDIDPPEWVMLVTLGLWACAARLADLAHALGGRHDEHRVR